MQSERLNRRGFDADTVKIGDVSVATLRARLSGQGIGLQLGVFEFRIQSPMEKIAAAVSTLYASHPLRPSVEFPDFRIRLNPERWGTQSYVIASVNGEIWHTWPSRLTVAAMEWVCSWCFFRGSQRWLTIHAASAAPPGQQRKAILFPGVSGVGKSTLASTLMMCGWHLLSDEIAQIDTEDLSVLGLGRPTILKGESIRMIRERFAANAIFGPSGHMTEPRLEIAHLRPTSPSVEQCGNRFQPSAIVVPKREPDSGALLTPLGPGDAFRILSQDGINFRSLGKLGYDTAVRLSKEIPIYQLTYSEATEAEQFLREHSDQVMCADGPGCGTAASVGGNRSAGTRRETPRSRPTPRPSIARSAGTDAMTSPHRKEEIDDEVATGLKLLRKALNEPESLKNLSLRQWDNLFPIAKHTDLLSRLAVGALANDGAMALPDSVRHRLEGERLASELNRKSIDYELRHLESVLTSADQKVVLLKGAAYLCAGFGWAAGRRTNDVDMLVAEDQVSLVESLLLECGYGMTDKFSAEDCRYFRRWLHEIPPLKHHYRQIEVDVHFRLLPISDPRSFPPTDMLRRSTALGKGAFAILDPVDRVLHCILNLARTGDYSHAFRDCWDLRCLIEEPANVEKHSGSPTDGFCWQEFVSRASAIGLSHSAALTLVLANDLVGLRLPSDICQRLTNQSARGLSRTTRYRIMRKASLPSGPTLRSKSRMFAAWLMEHHPLPKVQTWMDPLTWTKRVSFLRDR